MWSFCFNLLIAMMLPVSPAIQAQGHSDAPRFQDYPVKEVFKGKPVKVHWLSDYPQHEFFKASVSDLIGGGVNFAGHYAVREWSCGTNCRWLVTLDMKTGEFIRGSPYGALSLTDQQRENDRSWLQFRPDSRLLIVTGCFDVESQKKPVECGTKYFRFQRERFILLRYDPQPTPEYFK